MSRFPRELDYSRTSHFLFELGSMMTTLFAIFLIVSAIAIGIGLLLGSVPHLGLFAAGISGLLLLFGVGVLYVSMNVE
ncbi:hypothetical protein GJ633_00170 [Halorubrum sp. CBA1125]|uniref:hypothetical protein n=1 Tax=Halorubrum sp. CBA1125 TaxID=2668072 RepID=UPI0012E8E8F5|nr:hypothetical protein [Halorubrum sp. CBA1125]MUW13234.1 hypothetical protein [Halorubrum sp. CBA1125]